MAIETISKPQAAIDAGLFTREEAAEYMGLKAYAFDRIAKHLAGVKLGGSTFYSKFQLQAYLSKMVNGHELANIQQPILKSSQPVEN